MKTKQIEIKKISRKQISALKRGVRQMKQKEFNEKFETDYGFAITVIEKATGDNLDVTDRDYYVSTAVKEGIYELEENNRFNDEEIETIKTLAKKYDVVVEIVNRDDAQANNYRNAQFEGYNYKDLKTKAQISK